MSRRTPGTTASTGRSPYMAIGLEEFRDSLLRSQMRPGEALAIIEVRADGQVIISDGERSAPYQVRQGVPLQGEELRIARGGVETGHLSEARFVAITDGKRIAIYVPAKENGTSLPKLLAH